MRTTSSRFCDTRRASGIAGARTWTHGRQTPPVVSRFPPRRWRSDADLAGRLCGRCGVEDKPTEDYILKSQPEPEPRITLPTDKLPKRDDPRKRIEAIPTVVFRDSYANDIITRWISSTQPGVAMLCDKFIIVQVRIIAVHPVDLLGLSGTEGFAGVKAPKAGQEALSAEDLMQPWNAASKTIGGVEERGVGVCDLPCQAEQIWRHSLGS